MHWACENLHINVAEYLMDQPRIDPLAEIKDGFHALMLALGPPEEDEAPDQGLPILDLFHRKAPKALELPGQQGKEFRCDRCWLAPAFSGAKSAL